MLVFTLFNLLFQWLFHDVLEQGKWADWNDALLSPRRIYVLILVLGAA